MKKKRFLAAVGAVLALVGGIVTRVDLTRAENEDWNGEDIQWSPFVITRIDPVEDRLVFVKRNVWGENLTEVRLFYVDETRISVDEAESWFGWYGFQSMEGYLEELAVVADVATVPDNTEITLGFNELATRISDINYRAIYYGLTFDDGMNYSGGKMFYGWCLDETWGYYDSATMECRLNGERDDRMRNMYVPTERTWTNQFLMDNGITTTEEIRAAEAAREAAEREAREAAEREAAAAAEEAERLAREEAERLAQEAANANEAEETTEATITSATPAAVAVIRNDVTSTAPEVDVPVLGVELMAVTEEEADDNDVDNGADDGKVENGSICDEMTGGTKNNEQKPWYNKFMDGIKTIIAFASGFVLAQALKLIIALIRGQGRKNKASLKEILAFTFRSGGMPSGHAASLGAATTYIGLSQGFDSVLFALAICVMIIVIYDAVNVRYAVGEQGKALNKMVEKPLKVVEGHTVLQAVAGLILGIAIGVAIFSLF